MKQICFLIKYLALPHCWNLTFETCTNLQFAADFTLTYGFLHGCSSLQCERLSRIRLTNGGKPLSAIIFTEFKFEEFRQLSVEKITAVSCSDTLLSYLFGHQWQLPVNMSWMISPWGAERTLQMKSGRLSTRKSSSTCNKVQEWVTYHLPTTELQVS